MLTQEQSAILQSLIAALVEDTKYQASLEHTGTPEEVSDAVYMIRVTRAKLARYISSLTTTRKS